MVLCSHFQQFMKDSTRVWAMVIHLNAWYVLVSACKADVCNALIISSTKHNCFKKNYIFTFSDMGFNHVMPKIWCNHRRHLQVGHVLTTFLPWSKWSPSLFFLNISWQGRTWCRWNVYDIRFCKISCDMALESVVFLNNNECSLQCF